MPELVRRTFSPAPFAPLPPEAPSPDFASATPLGYGCPEPSAHSRDQPDVGGRPPAGPQPTALVPTTVRRVSSVSGPRPGAGGVGGCRVWHAQVVVLGDDDRGGVLAAR